MAVTILFLPLLSAILVGFFGTRLGERVSQLLPCSTMTLSAILSLILLLFSDDQGYVVDLLRWITSGDFQATWSLRIDALTLVMMFVVTSVSAAIHWYSIGYMEHDPHKSRFMAYLSLFTFFMLSLVTANNFVQLYFGWEGVGLCSYLLINFWYEKKSANDAAIKAFLVNRVGDFGFALGIMGIYLLFGSIEFDTVFASVEDQATETITFLGLQVPALSLVCLLLFMGAMGKSAQLGLHTWLPDAMEGPTPVSALIHAATMVTAGIFMVVRLSPLFEYTPGVLEFIMVIGALTAFMAATIALTQFDIKRVIAYSTMSQLGYMFCAIGASGYQIAIFHLYTHAFFKALLFLGAGSVIHAMSNEQDMRKMGGLWRKIPWTYAMMWIGSLALAGIPFFSGFYSKDLILEVVYSTHSPTGILAFWLILLTVPLTAFYSWRLIFLTFHGTPSHDPHVASHIHESPKIMLIPLGFLALGAITAGLLSYNWLVGHDQHAFWQQSIFTLPQHQWTEAIHHIPTYIVLLPTLLSLLGIGVAYGFYMYKPSLSSWCAQVLWPLDHLFKNKWYFDHLYQKIFVTPMHTVSRFLWQKSDVGIIDTYGPNGIASFVRQWARQASRLQSGYVFHYAFAMVIGVVIFVSWFYVKHWFW